MKKKVYDYKKATLEATYDAISNWEFIEGGDLYQSGYDCDGYDEAGFSPEGLDEYGFDAERKIWIKGKVYYRKDFQKTRDPIGDTIYTKDGPCGTVIVLSRRDLTFYSSEARAIRFFTDGLGTGSIQYATFGSYSEYKKARDNGEIRWALNLPIEQL